MEEPFLKKGILLIVDGTDPDLVRAIMETELRLPSTQAHLPAAVPPCALPLLLTSRIFLSGLSVWRRRS